MAKVHLYPVHFKTDAVKYGNVNGDKNASMQFGVPMSRIKYWRRKFRELSTKPKSKQIISSPNHGITPAQGTSVAAVSSSYQLPAVNAERCDGASSKRNSVAMDDDEKILSDWLLERMESGDFPTQTQIGQKARELNLKRSRQRKSAAAFLHRSGLYGQWIVGSKKRRSLNLSHMNVDCTPRKRVETSSDQERLEKLLAEWVTSRLNSGYRPTLMETYERYKELADAHKIQGKEHKNPTAFAHLFLVKQGLLHKWQLLLHTVDNNEKEIPNKLLIEWVEGSLKSGYKPTHKEIYARYQMFAKMHKVRILAPRSPKGFSVRFLKRAGLYERWCNMNRKMDDPKSSNDTVKTCSDAIEQQLCDWLRTEFTNDTCPAKKDIIAKVRKIMKELNIWNFNPTDAWYQDFIEKKCPLYTRSIRKGSNASFFSPNEDFLNDETLAMESVQMENEDDEDTTFPSEYPSGESNDDAIDGSFQTDSRHNVSSDSPVQTAVTSVDLPATTDPSKPNVASFLPSSVVSPVKQKNSECEAVSMPCSKKQKLEKPSSGGVVVKRKFGSFHSSNLDEQLQFAETDCYVPGELPVRPPMFEMYTISDCKFGSTVRKKHFFLEQGCVYLSHGAFGGSLKEALDYYHDWQRYLESRPLRFFDRVLFPQIVHVQKRLAEFIGCKASEITFTTNVTTAINAVLQGLPLNVESSIYYLSLTYDAVKKVIKHVCARTGAKSTEVAVTLPLSKPEDIVSLVRSTLKSTTTLAIFDHIPSDYAFIMPVKELVSVCHQRGVQVLIDGAHALGQLHLDLSTLGADYYMGNCHTWFCGPKGCAFMYVNKQLQRLTRGLIISHGYDDGFHSQFSWTGAKDYCSYLSLHALINFWTTVGPDKIRDYCKSLLKETAQYYKLKWNAELLAPIEYHGMMCCISLPSALYSGKDVSYDDAEAIQNRLYSEFNIEVPIICIGNKLYVRISAHIYNEFSEYATLASAILQIVNAAK